MCRQFSILVYNCDSSSKLGNPCWTLLWLQELRTMTSIGLFDCVLCLIHGATNIRNTTWELTGFPGSPKMGVLFHKPNNGDEPSLSFTLQKCTSLLLPLSYGQGPNHPLILRHWLESNRILTKLHSILPQIIDCVSYKCRRTGSCPSHFTKPDNPRRIGFVNFSSSLILHRVVLIHRLWKLSPLSIS